MSINWITLPGLTEYDQGLQIMEDKLQKVISNQADESIFLLEHEHVYTAGTNYDSSELLIDSNNKIPVFYTGRGGKFTYHGPGQRIIYPILNLGANNRAKDIRFYVRNLENWLIASLARIGLRCFTMDGLVGIWTLKNTQPAKIAAIGVRVKKWVTYHGIAVNISNDLSYYNGIIPCGVRDYSVTSIYDLGVNVNLERFDQILKEEFNNFF